MLNLCWLCCFLFQPRQRQPWCVAPACWCTSAGPQNPGFAVASAGMQSLRHALWRRKVVRSVHGALATGQLGRCGWRDGEKCSVSVADFEVQLLWPQWNRCHDHDQRSTSQPREGDLEQSRLDGSCSSTGYLINWQVLPGIRVIHHVGVQSELAKKQRSPHDKVPKVWQGLWWRTL